MDEAEKNGFHFFSTVVLVSHAYIHVVEHNCGVEINGLRILPGDLVYADKHGVVKIPHQVAPRLAQACRAVADAELPMLEPCRAALAKGELPSIDNIKRWRETMTKARNSASEQFAIPG